MAETEKAKGKTKEAYGAMTGDEGKKADGQAQQRKASAREGREQQKRTKSVFQNLGMAQDCLAQSDLITGIVPMFGL